MCYVKKKERLSNGDRKGVGSQQKIKGASGRATRWGAEQNLWGSVRSGRARRSEPGNNWPLIIRMGEQEDVSL